MSQVSQKNPKITDFKDLISWQKSHQYCVEIYKTTAHFPKSEQFGLTNQIRRAGVSIASNIAEGFGRRTSSDRLHFYDMARGSLHETQAQLLIALEVGFLSKDLYAMLEEMSTDCHKLLTGLINKTRSLDSWLLAHDSRATKERLNGR
jgi:four helix bundle protein